MPGLPSRDGSEFYINPAQIPAGVLLFIGRSPVGKPSGVIGPPGPMALGSVTTTRPEQFSIMPGRGHWYRIAPPGPAADDLHRDKPAADAPAHQRRAQLARGGHP